VFQTTKFLIAQMDCSRENSDRCCLTGRNDNEPDWGVHIVCTIDGGTSWSQNFFGPRMQSWPVAYTSVSEIWVGGCVWNRSASAYQTIIWNSVDAGLHWTNETLPFLLCPLDFSFPSRTRGFATCYHSDGKKDMTMAWLAFDRS